MSITVTLEFDATLGGVATARSELERFAADLRSRELPDGSEQGPQAGSAAAVEPVGVDESPAVTVYRNAEFEGYSRELLKVLPEKDEALMPAELGERMPPFEDGTVLEPRNVRAVLRNIKRNEAKRKREGEMAEDREVVKADWSRYDREGAGRYYLSREDREAILRWSAENE
jgi:hypothetical protein